ncbi:hypothetical protein E3N88_20650 [Mikania micrantha]|uniref:peptidylprolyl isomerase n=1 Tax=Mikania micrantha TaxID=192012 RepID=A0A5N6NK20_9ASTR|nr:hypothetical protein E3N88_20650 [Mikania micrantha]
MPARSDRIPSKEGLRVYLKPNEPYTLHYVDDDAVPNRLRVTQATLGDATRNSPARSLVRCSVGDKPAIAICSLSIKELTCCQLELEFEESPDVVFSVTGPRGVYLGDHKGREETIMEIGCCRDHDVHKDDLNSNITGGKHLLQCSRVKNIDGNFINPDQKTKKDGNEGSNNEDQEKTNAVKTHSVFDKLVEKKRRDTEDKKKKRKRKRKHIQSTSEATASESVDLWSSGAHEGNQENLKEKKKKSRRIVVERNASLSLCS